MSEPKKQCANSGCKRTAVARSMCATHYQHLRKTSGLLKVSESSSAWYCEDCTTGQRPGSYPCRLCCGYTGKRANVAAAAEVPT